MKLSGFNQEGGTVTGTIKNLEIESTQNTSKTDGFKRKYIFYGIKGERR